jgi:hypothetical protein
MKNPYLIHGRLPDIIAALTAMGAYKFYKLDFEAWANRIGGPQKSGEHWKAVFEDHPEFFRFDQGKAKASLVWRRTLPRDYDVDSVPEVLPDHQIPGTPYDRVSRRPLEPNEIQALISVAIELHERAIDQQRSSRWWIPVLTGVLAFAGAITGALLSSGG